MNCYAKQDMPCFACKACHALHSSAWAAIHFDAKQSKTKAKPEQQSYCYPKHCKHCIALDALLCIALLCKAFNTPTLNSQLSYAQQSFAKLLLHSTKVLLSIHCTTYSHVWPYLGPHMQHKEQLRYSLHSISWPNEPFAQHYKHCITLYCIAKQENTAKWLRSPGMLALLCKQKQSIALPCSSSAAAQLRPTQQHGLAQQPSTAYGPKGPSALLCSCAAAFHLTLVKNKIIIIFNNTNILALH